MSYGYQQSGFGQGQGYQQPPGGYNPPPPGGYNPPPPGGYNPQPGAPPGGYNPQPGAPPGGYNPAGQPAAMAGAQPGGYRAPPLGGYNPPPPGGAPAYGAPPSGAYPPPHAPGHGGGYGAPPGYGASPPPPGVSPDLWQWFQSVDNDRNGRIAADELRNALMNGDWSPFNAETCRLMIGMFDKDKNGTIDIHEFSALWKYIQEWKGCFDRFDLDRSGNIDANELANAFRTFGYNLSPNFTQLCVRVFDRQNFNTMKFDDFIQCCVMLKTLTDAFRQKDKTMSGTINIHYEEFLTMVLDNTIVK